MRLRQIIISLFAACICSLAEKGGYFISPPAYFGGLDDGKPDDNLRWAAGSIQNVSWKLQPDYSGNLEIYLHWYNGTLEEGGPQIKSITPKDTERNFFAWEVSAYGRDFDVFYLRIESANDDGSTVNFASQDFNITQVTPVVSSSLTTTAFNSALSTSFTLSIISAHRTSVSSDISTSGSKPPTTSAYDGSPSGTTFTTHTQDKSFHDTAGFGLVFGLTFGGLALVAIGIYLYRRKKNLERSESASEMSTDPADEQSGPPIDQPGNPTSAPLSGETTIQEYYDLPEYTARKKIHNTTNLQPPVLAPLNFEKPIYI